MGHFSQTCALTRLPITETDELIVLPVASTGFEGSFDQYTAIGGVFEGEYDGYGRVENVKANAFTENIMANILNEPCGDDPTERWFECEFSVNGGGATEAVQAHLLLIHKRALESVEAQFAQMDPAIYWETNWAEPSGKLPSHMQAKINDWRRAVACDEERQKNLEKIESSGVALEMIEKLKAHSTTAAADYEVHYLARMAIPFASDTAAAVAHFESEEGAKLLNRANNVTAFLYGVGSRLEFTRGGYQDPQYYLSRAIATATDAALSALETRWDD